MKRLILLISLTSLISGCITPSGKSYAQASLLLRAGDSESTVIKTMGNPDGSEIAGRDKVLKFCGTGGLSDEMVYAWFQDGYLKQVVNDQNTRNGSCTKFFKSVNWASTSQHGYLYLNELAYRPSSNSNNAMYDALENSMQQNNQMYNSLIDNMGTQQRALQPQRLETNCMWIGNMLSCN